MYCSNCGKEVKEKEAYCSSCGWKIGETEQKTGREQEYRNFSIRFTEQEFKWFIFKLIYIALIYLVWKQSQKGMFELAQYYRLNIDELMDKVFSIKQYMEESVLLEKVCYWCYEISIFGYVAAAVFAMLQKEEVAKTFSNIGFLLHFPIWIYATYGVLRVMNFWSFSEVYLWDAAKTLNKEFWLYLVLNIVIAICGAAFFSNVETARRYRSKSYSIIKPGMIETKKMENGDWRCVECGKVNAGYVHTCSCGCNKEA